MKPKTIHTPRIRGSNVIILGASKIQKGSKVIYDRRKTQLGANMLALDLETGSRG